MHAVSMAPMEEGQADLEQGLEAHFGLTRFRPGQADVIRSVLSGRNTVVVMPTGAGKSLCFQLPAMLLDGVTVVVSPLIALMQDQVDQLQARGLPATFINSTLSDAERADRQRRLRGGEYKLVYVAPERFRSGAFVEALQEARIALYAIDEAHCISQWGHDFRPDYALLGQVRKRLRPPRTVALTATATPEVREDITRVLLLKEPRVFVAGFDRPNLFLEVLHVTGDADKRQAVTQLVEQGSGVVYCSTRKQAEGLHAHLLEAGAPSVLYHAGLEDDARRVAQEQFMSTPGSVAVATNAFGMGIDKPDIRFVAHAGIPRAVEAYYQEIGRAGRDGQPSQAVLLFNHADVYTQERLIQSNHPPHTLFRDVWEVLREEERFERGVHQLAAQVGSTEFEISAVLKVLEREGLIARAARGEGRYVITLLPGAASSARVARSRALLQALQAAAGPGGRLTTELSLLARRSGLGEDEVKAALSTLERGGAITVGRPFAGRAISIHSHQPWAALGLDLERLRRQEQNQLLLLKRMTDYGYTKRCRRAFILRYFGEDVPFAQACGTCDVCAGARLKLSSARKSTPTSASGGGTARPGQYSTVAAEALRRWRRELAQDLGVAPFIIFNDATLFGLAAVLPLTREDFLSVKGTGESRWERFGASVVKVCRAARDGGEAPQAVELALPRKRRR
jgi:ATP-dependent DNA helicase RecQ